jgi:LmbE family N-acetylglucosaminyl deacetylase
MAVLALGAHPDDVEIGCGATLARIREAGGRVVAVTFSGGELGCREDEKKRRVEEAFKAAKTLDYELKIYDFADTMFMASFTQIVKTIEEAVQTLKPDVIFVHSSNDVHQDHRTLYDAAMVATRHARCSILGYENCRTDVEFKPDLFVDIQGVLSRKITAVKAHQTQSGKCSVDIKKIKATATFRGSQGRVELAEAFKIYRIVI